MDKTEIFRNIVAVDEKKLESIIQNAIQTGIVEAIKIIYSDKIKLIELIEDIGLSLAMEQGETGEYISRDELFGKLENCRFSL